MTELPLFTDFDQHHVLQPAALTSEPSNILTAVEQQAAADADAAAFISSEYSGSQTVSQLVRSSVRCSDILRANNVGPGSSTAMELSGPGPEAAVGLLGILRCGSSAVLVPTSTTQQQLPRNVTALLSTSALEDSCIATATGDSALQVSAPWRP